mmetsp:Transcript_11433/g.25457  ORF Transcript_11433/g.25457 Transcript_11433/m.25457 type:complete len:231 (-) Transcript_11433:32-724(-)
MRLLSKRIPKLAPSPPRRLLPWNNAVTAASATPTQALWCTALLYLCSTTTSYSTTTTTTVFASAMPPSNRIQPVGDQESVWDYPRPPRVEPVPERLRVVYNGQTIVDTTDAFRVLETSHPPTYYIPPQDIEQQYMKQVPAKTSYCEWKGSATYYNVQVDGKTARSAAWAYDRPTKGFTDIAGYVSFYASHMDACYVGDEQVAAQDGDFYGGWITSKIVGPFKGGAGTWGW